MDTYFFNSFWELPLNDLYKISWKMPVSKRLTSLTTPVLQGLSVFRHVHKFAKFYFFYVEPTW